MNKNTGVQKMNKLEIGNIVRINKYTNFVYYELAEINNDEAKLFFVGLGRQIEYAEHKIVKLKDLIKVQKNNRYTRFNEELRELIIERNYKNKEVQ
jgi:hypothetical protein